MSPCNRTRRVLACAAIAALAALLPAATHDPGPPAPAPAEREAPGRGPAPDSAGLLQFRSGRHAVGFQAGQVCMASSDHALTLEFVGGSRVAPVAVTEAVTAVAPSATVERERGPRPLGRVEYRSVWDGVTVRFDATPNGIAESTYVVEPGADVSTIGLRYNVPVETVPDGSLVFRLPTRSGSMTESAPVAWQEIGGTRVPVEVAFQVTDGVVGFDAAAYDRRHALVIDPVYEWHTFHGQVQNDEGNAVAIDSSGNVYVAGLSFNSLTPGTWNGDAGQPPLHPHSGGPDIMVTKLGSDGSYQWHTFYGDADRQWANGIAVDEAGDVYVTGLTDGAQWRGDGNTDPVRFGSADGEHVVVLKLSTDGAYRWHTFYGSWVDEGNAIAVGGGSVFMTGRAAGAGGQGWLGMTALHDHTGDGYDLVVLKLAAGDGAYMWHTFYGAPGDDGYDQGRGVALDGDGNVYVTGESLLTWGIPLHDHSPPGNNGKPDTLVLKLSGDGAYRWHTFFGATYANPYWAVGEFGFGVALDGRGGVYVAGQSSATWQGPAGQDPLHPYSGAEDATVLKLDADGAYQWHTFYGSTGHDYGRAIAVNGRSVYVAGDGYGTWLGDLGAAPLHPHGPNRSLAVMKLDTDGAYQWHTFYGADEDIGNGVAADGDGHVVVTGNSHDTWKGDGGALPIHDYTPTGYAESFVLRLDARVVPSEGTYGTQFTISGAGYGDRKGRVLVGKAVAKIVRWTDTSIVCAVSGRPLRAGPADVVIAPKSRKAVRLTGAFTVKAPEVDGLADRVGASGEEMSVTGTYFGTRKGKLTLETSIGGRTRRTTCKVTAWSMVPATGASECRFLVPKVSRRFAAGDYTVRVGNVVGSAAAPDSLTVEP